MSNFLKCVLKRYEGGLKRYDTTIASFHVVLLVTCTATCLPFTLTTRILFYSILFCSSLFSSSLFSSSLFSLLLIPLLFSTLQLSLHILTFSFHRISMLLSANLHLHSHPHCYHPLVHVQENLRTFQVKLGNNMTRSTA